ncbi:hypothetical protein NX773_18310 [Massilia solisilvae]|uniref:Immunity protein 72 domain-containing protein n=1 Tax=Massilia solisilvae TaxID=1811225 RepID=A0ABT2BNQ7_9BURK|nr:hypothetical protein [Massilia solisilvae]MCS0610124.1 hypothetical protein [Massilia solisilvae]
MRDLHREAAIWYLFTSPDFFELAAAECEGTTRWFGELAISRKVANFGRNNQVFDTLNKRAKNFRRGAELARLGDYMLAWDTAASIRGDMRGMMEQPLHSWMTEAEYEEFNDVRTDKLSAFARQIEHALHNALWGFKSYENPLPSWPESINYDGGFPGDEIAQSYDSTVIWYKGQLPWVLPDPLPEYAVDRSISCQTGDEVPWTGVWYPSTGMERHSLTFAIKGLRMQPAYRVVKTTEELRTESNMFPPPETLAVPTTWHPLIPTVKPVEANTELWAKAGQPCPKAGVWQAPDPGAVPRAYAADEKMANLGCTYGITVWRWMAER